MFSISLSIVLATFIAIVPNGILAICPEVPDPRDFTFVISGNLGVATWYEPTVSAGCKLNYLVEYYVNGQPADQLTTDKEFQIFDRIKLCSTLEVRITSVDASDPSNTSGQPVTRSANTDIATISNLRIEGDEAVWDVPSYSEECSYEIRLDGTPAGTVPDNKYELIDIPACSDRELTVTPKHNDGNFGTPLRTNVKIGVDILDIKQVDTILTWETSSTNNDDCTFNLQFDTNLPITVKGNTYDLEDADLKPCLEYKAVVSYDISSKDTTVDIPPGKLEDFVVDYDADDKIIGTWSDKYEECTIVIAVDGGPEYTFPSGPVEFPESGFYFCENHEITARATTSNGDISGETVKFPFRKRIDQIQIFSIEETVSGFEAIWDDDYKRCNIELDINGVPYTGLTGSSYFLGDLGGLHFCETYTATLQIEETEYVGIPIEKKFIRQLGEITDVTLDYSVESEITVIWGDEIEKCDVDIIIDSASILADRTSDTTAKLDTDNLKYCILNNAQLIASYGTFEKTKDFDITIAGTLEDFQISPNSAGDLVASWSDKFAECTVEVDINGDKLTLTKDDLILTGFSPAPCVYNTIIAYVVNADGNKGAPVTTHYTKGATLKETEFDFFQTKDYIHTNWLDDFDTCMFELIVLPDYAVIQNVVKGEALDISYCTLHPIIVRLMSEIGKEEYDEVDSEMFMLTFELQNEFDIIDNIALKLDVQDVTVSWEASSADACGLSYDIRCNNIDQEFEEEITATEHTFECIVDDSITLYSMVITPKYIGIEGASIECNYDVVTDGAGNVMSLQLTDGSIPSNAKCPSESELIL